MEKIIKLIKHSYSKSSYKNINIYGEKKTCRTEREVVADCGGV